MSRVVVLSIPSDFSAFSVKKQLFREESSITERLEIKQYPLGKATRENIANVFDMGVPR